MKLTRRKFTLAAGTLAALKGAPSCSAPSSQDDPVRVGLLLSYSGFLAAKSINSERAITMAIDQANESGGIDGRPVQIFARDTRSNPRQVRAPVRELLDGGAALIIGPDYTDLVSELRTLLEDRTVVLPSFATASDVEWKPPSWFVMGAGLIRVACELVALARNIGSEKPLQIISSSGYNSSLSFTLSNLYSLQKLVLPHNQASTAESVEPLRRVMENADSYLLAAPPDAATSLFYALSALGALGDPKRWILSPTLHTPAFLASVPRGLLNGARGVAPGTVAGAGAFRKVFVRRWHEEPLDDAYPYFDAGAIASLAIQRALREEGTIPTGRGLSKHIIAVTGTEGVSVGWNEIGRGLELLQQGEEISYFGVTGQLAFDAVGETLTAHTKWWEIRNHEYVDIPRDTDCR